MGAGKGTTERPGRVPITALQNAILDARRRARNGEDVRSLALRFGRSRGQIRQWLKGVDCAECDRPVAGPRPICKSCSQQGPSQVPGQEWDPSTIAAAFHRWVALTGNPPSSKDWERSNHHPAWNPVEFPSRNDVIGVFDTWNNGLSAADPRYVYDPADGSWARRPDSELLAGLLEWTRLLARPVVWSDRVPAGRDIPSVSVIADRFGGLDAAKKLVGLPTESRAHVAWQQAIETMCGFYLEHGHWPTLKEWTDHRLRPSRTAIGRLGGTFSELRAQAATRLGVDLPVAAGVRQRRRPDERRECLFDGCTDAHVGLGYCQHHYNTQIVTPRRRARKSTPPGA